MKIYFSGRRRSDADRAAAGSIRDGGSYVEHRGGMTSDGTIGFGRRGTSQNRYNASPGEAAPYRHTGASRFIVLASLICLVALTLYLYNGSGGEYTAVSAVSYDDTAVMQYDMGDAAYYAEQVIAENEPLARFLGINVDDGDDAVNTPGRNPNEAVYVAGEVSYSDSMRNTLPGNGGKWSIWDYFSDVLAELIEW